MRGSSRHLFTALATLGNSSFVRLGYIHGLISGSNLARDAASDARNDAPLCAALRLKKMRGG